MHFEFYGTTLVKINKIFCSSLESKHIFCVYKEMLLNLSQFL